MAQTDRRLRHLSDLTGRTFVNTEYRDLGAGPDACYGCARIFDIDTTMQGYVTSAAPSKPGGPKQILWVCRPCFDEFHRDLSFRVDASLTREDVVRQSALGPAI